MSQILNSPVSTWAPKLEEVHQENTIDARYPSSLSEPYPTRQYTNKAVPVEERWKMCELYHITHAIGCQDF